MKLPEVVKGYRQSQKMSLRELASTIGIGQMPLYRFENGQPISGPVWGKIMVWLFSTRGK